MDPAAGHSGDEAIGTSMLERSQEVPPAADDAAVRQQRQGEEADNVITASANNDDDDNDGDEGANIAAVDTVAGGETASLQNVPEGIDGDARREGVAAGLPVPGTRVPVLTADATVAGVSQTLATRPTFLKLVSTNTYSHFLTIAELANLVDEEKQDLRDVLVGSPRLKMPLGHVHLLRSFGIIKRTARNAAAWCLLGVGSIRTFVCPDKDHLLSGEPQPRYWNTGSADDYDEDFPDGVSPLIIGEEVTELAWEAAEQTTCRRCDQRPPAPTLRYVRLESLWSPLLRPGVEAEVGLRFECSSCGAINLGSPLPVRGRTGRRWTTADVAVKIVGLSAPALEKPPQRAGSRRGRRGRSREPAVETHDGSGVSGARRSALAGASSNATTPGSNNRRVRQRPARLED